MCLAIPARIVSVGDNRIARVEVLGVTRDISLDLTPDAGANDWVLMHAGFAIQQVDEEFANESLDLIKQLPYFADITAEQLGEGEDGELPCIPEPIAAEEA